MGKSCYSIKCGTKPGYTRLDWLSKRSSAFVGTDLAVCLSAANAPRTEPVLVANVATFDYIIISQHNTVYFNQRCLRYQHERLKN
jgi:hypothetical protein